MSERLVIISTLTDPKAFYERCGLA